MAALTDDVRKFLSEIRFGALATINRDGTPQQSVMWYDLRDDRIMMNTLVGRVKEKNLRRDPRISLCVEDGYNYVTIKGRAELDYDRERSQALIRELAIKYNGQETGERQAQNLFSKQERVNIHMTIESVDVHL